MVCLHEQCFSECRMRQPHPKIGIILFLCGVGCGCRIRHSEKHCSCKQTFKWTVRLPMQAWADYLVQSLGQFHLDKFHALIFSQGFYLGPKFWPTNYFCWPDWRPLSIGISTHWDRNLCHKHSSSSDRSASTGPPFIFEIRVAGFSLLQHTQTRRKCTKWPTNVPKWP
jgi:hypothetical protein